MNKILPIILVIVLSGCATSPKYYDRNNISWNELEECNLSVPECLALNTVCQDNPRQCRFKPYDYVHECNDAAIQCKHEETQIVKKAVSIYWDTIDSESHNNTHINTYTWWNWLKGETDYRTPANSGYRKPSLVNKKNIDLTKPSRLEINIRPLWVEQGGGDVLDTKRGLLIRDGDDYIGPNGRIINLGDGIYHDTSTREIIQPIK